jgi:hypothetical protein
LNSLELTLDSISLIENPIILTLLSDFKEYKVFKALFIEDNITLKPIKDNSLLNLAQEENILPLDILKTSNNIL